MPPISLPEPSDYPLYDICFIKPMKPQKSHKVGVVTIEPDKSMKGVWKNLPNT